MREPHTRRRPALAARTPRLLVRAQVFVAATQAQTALLTTIDANAPRRQRQVVRKIERENTAALTVAARDLHRSSTAPFDRALRLLGAVEFDATAAQGDVGIAEVRPWPSTTLERLELAAMALVLLTGILTLGKRAFRAAGLRREDRNDGQPEIQRLIRVARSDSLTGLGNLRAFQDDLSKVIERRNKAGVPFAMLAFDLDGLKQVNDIEATRPAMSTSRMSASSIREEVGERGTVYRTGGDEFMAFFPSAGAGTR